jgi:hypothetical protein
MAIKPSKPQTIFVVSPKKSVVMPDPLNPKGQPKVYTEGQHILPEQLSEDVIASLLRNKRIFRLTRDKDAEAMDEILDPKAPKPPTKGLTSVSRGSRDFDPAALDAKDFDSLVKLYKEHTKNEHFPDNKADIIEELSVNFVPSENGPPAVEPSIEVTLNQPPPPLK